MFPSINRDLLPIKAHYFLFNAATGPMVPFLPTIAKQLGFSGFLVGTIYTILPISGLVAKPLFGGLADKYKLQKLFFLFFQVLVALGFLIIYFIPKVDDNVKLSCHRGVAFLEICSNNVLPNHITTDLSFPLVNSTECKLSCQAYDQLRVNWDNSTVKSLMRETKSARFNFKATLNISKELQISERCVGVPIQNTSFMDNTKHVLMCPQQIITFCIARCENNSPLDELLNEVRNSKQSTTYQFHIFFTAAVISWIAMAVVVSIADAICFDLLGMDNRKEYGKQKMWGSIGFGIFGISAGYLVDIFSQGQTEKDYTCIFYIMLIAMLLDVIVSSILKKKHSESSLSEEPSIFRELFTVMKEGRMLAFGWWCIGTGMCTGVVWNFLFWYTEDLAVGSQSEWIKTLQGLLIGVQCFLGELPFNFLSGSILRKLGHINVMSLVLLTYAIRFMAYSMVSNPWIFLFLEVLHGPSLGLCWPTMVSYGDRATPPGTKATMQGFIGAIFEGIGVSSGSFICGWLMDTLGGAMTFRLFSTGALLWLSVFWLMQLLLRKMKAFPIHQGHNHLVSYANPDDAILMTMSQELQTY